MNDSTMKQALLDAIPLADALANLARAKQAAKSKPTPAKAKRLTAKQLGDFPLWTHRGSTPDKDRWCRKIKGRFHYFGKVADDPDGQAALAQWNEQKDDLLAGRTPRVGGDGLTIADLGNRFLAAKEAQKDNGEITHRSWLNYKRTTDMLVAQFGKRRLVADLAADDFEALRRTLADGRGPVALGNEIQHVRIVFKYAYDAGLIEQPVRYGPMFKRPSKKVLRLARAAKGPRMFEADELRALVKAAAGSPLEPMILLGLNCGFGNGDCGTLPIEALDLDRGWVTFPRPKTGINRRCPLWPETVKAIRQHLAKRPEPASPDLAGLVFLTVRGASWAKEGTDNPVTKEFVKLLKELGMHRGNGLGFYAIRHTFQTIGDEARDPVATTAIMGHADQSMSAVYRERVSDDRLKAVTDHVRQWYLKTAAPKSKRSRKPAA